MYTKHDKFLAWDANTDGVNDVTEGTDSKFTETERRASDEEVLLMEGTERRRMCRKGEWEEVVYRRNVNGPLWAKLKRTFG